MAKASTSSGTLVIAGIIILLLILICACGSLYYCYKKRDEFAEDAGDMLKCATMASSGVALSVKDTVVSKPRRNSVEKMMDLARSLSQDLKTERKRASRKSQKIKKLSSDASRSAEEADDIGSLSLGSRPIQCSTRSSSDRISDWASMGSLSSIASRNSAVSTEASPTQEHLRKAAGLYTESSQGIGSFTQQRLVQKQAITYGQAGCVSLDAAMMQQSSIPGSVTQNAPLPTLLHSVRSPNRQSSWK